MTLSPEPIKIALVDDEPAHLEISKQKLALCLSHLKRDYLLREFPNADLLSQAVSSRIFLPDLAVLDIEMPGRDGIELAKGLNMRLPDCRIIFLTSYPDYAPQVYETRHIWFVLKNRADDFLEAALKKAIEAPSAGQAENPVLLIRDHGKTVAVKLSDIQYLSRVGRKAVIFIGSGSYEDTRSPQQLLKEFPDHSFIHCHQGYWINPAYIEALDHEEFILSSGVRLPISRTYRQEARRAFLMQYRL